MSLIRPLVNEKSLPLFSWLERRTFHVADRSAITFKKQAWTYRELIERVEKLSAVFVEGGLGPGDRVAYLGYNHPMFLVALFAAARIGAIFVPVNFRLTSHEVGFILKDVEAHTLIGQEIHSQTVDEIADLPCRQYLRIGGAVGKWQDIDQLMADVQEVPGPSDVRSEATALVMYTSGTTGQPKGAMLSHANLWANNINWMLAVNFASADIGLTCAPMFHVGGLCVVTLPLLMAGGHVLLKEHFDETDFLETIERQKITVSFAVPAMMLRLCQHEAFDMTDMSSMRLLIAGGASVPEKLLKIFGARNIPVSQGWGMTETATAVTFLEMDLALKKLGSCGRAVMFSDYRLRDFSGNIITEPHVKGEILARGANVTRGYWDRPDATREVIDAEGWLASGDVGYLDEDGFLYVCDRVKDMVISGGENVYPAEVEGVLLEHAAVAEVAVIGVPDERWGERVVAVVVLRTGTTLTLDELNSHARQRLARYKCPRELRIIDVLPRNASGKVLKAELRNAVLSMET